VRQPTAEIFAVMRVRNPGRSPAYFLIETRSWSSRIRRRLPKGEGTHTSTLPLSWMGEVNRVLFAFRRPIKPQTHVWLRHTTIAREHQRVSMRCPSPETVFPPADVESHFIIRRP